jgi:hypothetical protein
MGTPPDRRGAPVAGPVGPVDERLMGSLSLLDDALSAVEEALRGVVDALDEAAHAPVTAGFGYPMTVWPSTRRRARCPSR